MSRYKVRKHLVPRAVHAAACKDLLLRIGGTVLYYGLIGSALVHYLRQSPAWKHGITVLLQREFFVLLFVFLFAIATSIPLFRLWRLFSDRCVCGVLTGSEVYRYYGRGRNRAGRLRIEEHMGMKLFVRDEANKTHTVRTQLPEGGFGSYYRVGDRILHFRGLPYPISPDAEMRGERICPWCGTIEREGHNVCAQCERHLLSFPEDFMQTND